MERLNKLERNWHASRKVLEERVGNLQAERNASNKIRMDIEATLKELNEMSIHPRHSACIPITNLVYNEATLCNTEYMLKSADHTIIASQAQMNNYVEAIMNDCKEKEQAANIEISQLQERLQITSEMAANKITEVSENAYIINHDDCMEIIEVEDTPYKKERVPRFKTAAERDEYIKSSKK